MDETERLKQLQERKAGYEQSVQNIDRDIRGAEDALIKGEEPARLVAFLRERHETQRGLIFDLGQIEARADDLQARIAERDGERPDKKSAERWEADDPSAPDDRAWYQKRNNAPAPSGENKADRSGQGQRDWFIKKDRPEPDDVDDDRDRSRTR